MKKHFNTKHGHCLKRHKPTPTYQSWKGMKRRCNDIKNKDYGGRGITVCDRWLIFQNFLEDMGERPEGKTLDRIDSDGNYEPSNCRWATDEVQNKNRRNLGNQKGDKNPNSKLTNDIIIEIKKELNNGVLGKSLAIKYSVSRSLISQIKTNKIWNFTQKHVVQ